MGTADYLSPEHILSPREMTPASDVYSLGCTLYYAVTGKVPFPGGTSRDKARRHCEVTPINPRRFNLDLSDEFIDVIAAMMEKETAKRIQTCAEVVHRLAPWARESVPTDDVPNRESLAASRPLVPAPGETEVGLFDDLVLASDPSASGSGSQISQRTDAVASARHETLPDIERAPRCCRGKSSIRPPLPGWC